MRCAVPFSPPEDSQPAAPGRGQPCHRCAASHLPTGGLGAPDSGEITATTQPAFLDPAGATTAPALAYRLWDWPLTRWGEQVWLDLTGDTVVAVLLPRLLAADLGPQRSTCCAFPRARGGDP